MKLSLWGLNASKTIWVLPLPSCRAENLKEVPTRQNGWLISWDTKKEIVIWTLLWPLIPKKLLKVPPFINEAFIPEPMSALLWRICFSGGAAVCSCYAELCLSFPRTTVQVGRLKWSFLTASWQSAWMLGEGNLPAGQGSLNSYFSLLLGQKAPGNISGKNSRLVTLGRERSWLLYPKCAVCTLSCGRERWFKVSANLEE